MSALWTADALKAASGGAMAVPFDAAGVSIDTRTLAAGEMFVALVGEFGDGHDHVGAAFARGATGALVHREVAAGPVLRVADTLEGLRGLGRFARARFGGRLAAVTGSVGKTTTKEMLRTILADQGETSAAAASLNNHWGLPLTLARLPAGARFAVAEIGMNHAGEILPLARMARPHVAVITNVEAAHIGFLGSIEAIADEKAALLDGLEPGGVAVLPGDSALLERLRARAPGRVRLFGSGEADARLMEARADAEGTDIAVALDGAVLRTRIGAPGRHMAMNAAAALLAAACLGADPVRGAASLQGFAPMAGRGLRRRIGLRQGSALLQDESYNASPVAVRAALKVLALQPATRRVVVLGDMRELGDAGPELHAGLAPDVAAVADLAFACGPLMKGMFDLLPAGKRGAHAAGSDALAPVVAAALRDGDAVLVKGSLGTRMKPIVDAISALGAS
jgi:UDP-N-acetylmuramoyl-tripeptide--D-alanyl-D-alanine ligase